jgi:hypothetical protein
MSIAGRSSGEAWKTARSSWTCTSSPQSVGGPRAGDTGHQLPRLLRGAISKNICERQSRTSNSKKKLV